MRVELNMNQHTVIIDTTDPDLLGKWITEMFVRHGEIHPSDWITIRAYPSFMGNADQTSYYHDWLNDPRIVGQQMVVKTPREFVEELSKTLDRLDAGEF